MPTSRRRSANLRSHSRAWQSPSRPMSTQFTAVSTRASRRNSKAARKAYPELRTAVDLIVRVEIVLDQEDGRLARLGVIKSSGSSAFDAVALAALRRAAPFGVPSRSIVSPGGKVYIHWDLHIDPFEACAPRNARPYPLATAPS